MTDHQIKITVNEMLINYSSSFIFSFYPWSSLLAWLRLQYELIHISAFSYSLCFESADISRKRKEGKQRKITVMLYFTGL